MERMQAMSTHAAQSTYKVRSKALLAPVLGLVRLRNLSGLAVLAEFDAVEVAAALASHYLLEVFLPIELHPDDMRPFLYLVSNKFQRGCRYHSPTLYS